MKRTKSYMNKSIDWLKHYSPLEHQTATTTQRSKPSFPYGNNVLNNHNNHHRQQKFRSKIQRCVIYWFRLNDLRIHDHPALLHACKIANQYFDHEHCHVIPVFCFDSNIFGNIHPSSSSSTSSSSNSSSSMNDTDNNSKATFLKCGVRRAKFILESVTDLRHQLQTKCRSDLIVGYQTTTPQFFHTLITDLKDYYRQLRYDEEEGSQMHRKHRRNISMSEDNNINNDDDDNHNPTDQEKLEEEELKFHITVVCQDEPVREERMQVYHVSKVLEYHNSKLHIDNSKIKTYDEKLWGRINRAGRLASSASSKSTSESPSLVLPMHNPVPTVQQIWGSTLYLPKQMSMHSSFHDMPNDFNGFSKKIRRNTIKKPYDIPIEYYKMPFPIGLYHPTTTTATTGTLILGTTSPPTPASSNNDDSNNSDIAENETSETTFANSNPNHHKTRTNPITYMPTLHDLGYTAEQIASTEIHHPYSQVTAVRGGETAGLQRVQEYIWDLNLLKYWSEMRQQPILQNQSTLWSPYLAHGCISPRNIAVEVKLCYRKRKARRAMVILQHELKMRDYNKFFCIKHGDGIFQKHGALPPNRRDVKPKLYLQHPEDFVRWTTGWTGYPLVDATMREISHTGYASYRCRLNAASFLVYDMKHDWRRGAQYFEEQLIDYDVYLNWWAWCNVAGFTTGRVFPRPVAAHDGKLYDPDGAYVKRWVPELEQVPKEFIHEPWTLNEEQQIEYNVRLGVDYPNPFLDPMIGEERRKKRAEKRERLRDMKCVRRASGKTTLKKYSR